MNIKIYLQPKGDELKVSCNSFEFTDGFVKFNKENETLYMTARQIRSFIVDEKIVTEKKDEKK